MNIFILDPDPKLAAQYHFDIHVGKMILESAQLLSTTHRELGSVPEGIYRSTHKNHPSAKWLRESTSNYMWLYQLYTELHNEFMYRRGKGHNSYLNLYTSLSSPPARLRDVGITPPLLAMPPAFKRSVRGLEDATEAYRDYYINGKPKSWRIWTNRETPSWMN